MIEVFRCYKGFEFNFKMTVYYNSRKEFEEILANVNQEFLKFVSKLNKGLPNVGILMTGPTFIREK